MKITASYFLPILILIGSSISTVFSLSAPKPSTGTKPMKTTTITVPQAETATTLNNDNLLERRLILSSLTTGLVAMTLLQLQYPQPVYADAAAIQDSLDIDTFLKTGSDTGGNMGVSSQAGKSRPQTGVVLRDGSDVLRDAKSGGTVSAEILTGTKINPVAVVVSFQSPWKLETGPVFDVECRDGKTGDGVFLAVSRDVNGKNINELSTEFIFERLFEPTGRFSFYGSPTDIKVKKSTTNGKYRYIDFTFSNLSQSTNAEIPRKAYLAATIPDGTNNVVMLVGSANASRWNGPVEKKVRDTVESFRAIPAPKTNMKLRAKPRGPDPIDF